MFQVLPCFMAGQYRVYRPFSRSTATAALPGRIAPGSRPTRHVSPVLRCRGRASVHASSSSSDGSGDGSDDRTIAETMSDGKVAAATAAESGQCSSSSNTSSSSSQQEADWSDRWQDADEWEQEEEEEEEDGDERNDASDVDDTADHDSEADEEQQAASFLRQYLPNQQQQAVMLEVLQEQAADKAIISLGNAMLASGFQGSLALGIGWLLGINVLQAFRWDVHDLSIGVLWALPAAAMAALIVLPQLPQPKQPFSPAAAAAAGGGTGVGRVGSSSNNSSSSSNNSSSNSNSSSSSFLDDDDNSDTQMFRYVRRMARSASLSAKLPLRIELPLSVGTAFNQAADGNDDDDGKAPAVTQLTTEAVLRSLRALQEYFTEPWSTDVSPPNARMLRVVEAQLRRVTTEVIWRALVTTGLSALLYNSLVKAGTSQDSLFFFARLFGVLTPQAGLTAAAGVMLAARIPSLWLFNFPFVMYTRLSLLDVSIVGQLSESDWLLRVQPATAAAGQAGTGSSSSSSSSTKAVPGALPGVQLFGKLKQQAEAGGEAAGQVDAGVQQGNVERSAEQMDRQVDRVLGDVAAFAIFSSSSSSSIAGTSRMVVAAGGPDSAAAAAAADAQALEQQGAELLSEVIELGREFGAVVKASTKSSGSSSKSSSGSSKSSSKSKKSSNKDSSSSSQGVSKLAAAAAMKKTTRLATAGDVVMKKLNSSRERRYFVCHMDDSGDDDDENDSSSNSSSSRDDESARAESAVVGDDWDEEVEESPADAFRRRVQEKLAAQRRQQWKEKTSGNGAAASSQQQQQEEQQEMAGRKGGEGGVSLLQDVTKDPEKWQVLKQMLEKAAAGLPKVRVLEQGWYAAATVPTAEDRFARWLLFLFASLSEVAPVGAFVATGGNAAASAVASCFSNVLTLVVNDVASQRAKQDVREALGEDWLLQLLPMQPEEQDD